MSDLSYCAHLLQGRVIDGRWRVGDRLGQGAMGVVFLCADARTNSSDEYVIKFIDSEQEREAFTALKLKDASKYLIPIKDADGFEPEDPKLPKKLYYIVMPKAECTLADKTMLDEMSMFTTRTSGGRTLTGLITDICNGLLYLHEKAPNAPLVHRDLKPANILYYKGNWVLADFGILRPGSLADTVFATKAYTKGYAPPEYSDDIDGRVPVKPSWDVYSLGVIIYQLCTGKPWEHKRKDLPEDDPALRDCREYLRRICAGCIRVNPEERLSVAEVITIVQDEVAKIDEKKPRAIKITEVGDTLYSMRSHRKQPQIKNEAMREALDTGRSVCLQSTKTRFYYLDHDSAIFQIWELADAAYDRQQFDFSDYYAWNSDDLRRLGARCLVYGRLPMNRIRRDETLRSLWLPSWPTQHEEELGFTV